MNTEKNFDQIHDLNTMTVVRSKPSTTGHESNLPNTQNSESPSTEAQKKKRIGKRRRLPSW